MNQYTKAEAEGTDKPKGANQFTAGKRTKHDEDTKDKMRAAKAAAKLEAIMDDPAASKGDVIAAGKELMRYGKLTADRRSEQEEDERSEEELMGQVKALITARQQVLMSILDSEPGLRAAVLAHITQRPIAVDPLGSVPQPVLSGIASTNK